ncbi:Por secretion system C-terminal sorting domain-containing protein [Cyclobacterium xiamenense]|uniref:Por secretion system C-terminal sorting domain-containing protein n=1 Tax=Cyclobacterium xiamenense TaxID=1297121 RepID=A0A1H6WFQ6_9BACT|nr:YCF48-related protein [Cyclobacterium xiamenense]SEJ14054.1 Por secretion system C-terminal sorting domain-containing protein [Cyclobacterium xiamenense]
MKRALFLVLVLLLLVQEGFGQSWRRVGHWGNDYTAIQWVNENVGYIAGENIFLKSIDGGLSWVELKSPTSGALLDLAFFDEQKGLALGEDGTIYRTQNAGVDWSSYSHGLGQVYHGLHFISEQLVLAVGTGGSIIRSENGGLSWADVPVSSHADIHGLTFANDTLGFAVTADSEILKTVNSGVNWVTIPSGFQAPLNGVYFTSDSVGYAVGNLGTIIKTQDGGNHWQFINSGIDTDLREVTFNPAFPQIGVINGDNGTILRTDNGGLTFLASNSRTQQNLMKLAFRPDTNNVLGVGSSGTLITSNNSGITWAVRLTGRSTDFTAVQFITDIRGFLTGEQGLILLTGNGGNSFVDRSRPISLPFNALYFVSAVAGFVAGNNGNIISTTNSGGNWTTLNPGTNRNVNGLHFFDFNRGFAVGERGLIAKTENRGINWEIIPSGAGDVSFSDIVFFDENMGLIVGDQGQLLRSDNGGANWSRVVPGTTADFRALTLLDDTRAILVGDGGTVFKTKDRGISWQRLQTGFDVAFSDVEFLDESVGFITGEEGIILRTFDAGETWEKLPTNTYQDFTGLSFGDLNVGYAVGENGIFYQYTCQVPQDIATIFGEDDICLSQQIYTIQDLEEEGTRYEWRVDGGTILEGQGTTRVVVRWDRPGRNAVMVRGQNKCGNGNTRALEVVVSDQPRQTTSIQGEGVVCVNTLEEYFVDSIPGTQYFWSATGGVVRAGQGTAHITLEWTNLDEQSVSVSTTNPCGQGPSTEKLIRVITIPDQPAAIEGPNRVGFQEADYEVPAEQDINYQWSVGSGGEIISGQGSPLVRIRWEGEGDHELEVTPMNACNQGPSQVLSVNVNLITSLPEREDDARLRVYPSPSFGDLYVHLEGLPSLSSLEVINAMGQKIREIPTREGQSVYPITGLPKGMHLLVFRTRTATYQRKIVVF